MMYNNVLPFNDEETHCPSGLGHVRDLFMMYRSNMVLRNWVMAIMSEVELMLGVCLHANVYVLAIYCMLIFFLLFFSWQLYAFFLFF